MRDLIVMVLILGIPLWCWLGVLAIEWYAGQRGFPYDRQL